MGDYLRNNSLNFLDTNKYALPGYLPPAGFSAQESETLLYITPGSSYSYPTYTPISNNFVLTLTGTASEPSCLQIQSENHLIDNLFWDTGQNTVSTESFYLNRGYAGLTIKLMSGYVNVTDIYVDIAPLCAKCSANIMASSVENGKSTLSLRNKNKDAVWSPAPGDAAPWIEFQFAHLLYLDHFTVTGETSQVKGFEIQTRTSEDRWSTVYHGTEIISCQAIYIQGTKSIKGTCFRILFTKLTGPIEISEIKLSPYINWAREDTGVSVQLSKESGISPDTIINGDRINPGWITVGGQTAVLTFSSPHTIDTVTVIGIQESVQEEKTGVIPDSDMTSAFVQRQYTLSYLNTSGKWVRSASYVTMPDGPDTQSQRKVINRFVLEKTVTAAAIQAEVGTSYWTRVIELEASESYELYETT